jgi:hypothetical protein
MHEMNPTTSEQSGNALGFSLKDLDRLRSILDSAEEVPSSREQDFLLEPTPLGPDGVQSLVKEVVVTDNTWYADRTFAHVLNPLLTNETSRFHLYQADQWKERFQDLIDFHEEHGHCLVPNNYPENQHLAVWVKRQRYQYKRKQMKRDSTITDERQATLQQKGFVWDSHKAAWIERFEALKLFKKEHGHCTVPSNYSDRPLASWVKCQRRRYKLYTKTGQRSTMINERFMQLKAVGFVWNPRNL